jgi:hypothetical protein
MTSDPVQSTAHPSLRADSRDEPWPMRPWIMAAICAVAGVVFYLLGEEIFDNRGGDPQLVGATFTAVATIAFVLTVERRRWWWSLLFAVAWGVIIGLVGLTTRSYNQSSTIFEWPFLAGIFAVLLAAPLFQAARDDGGWRFQPGRVHNHAWTDAVIGAASIVFTGISWGLAWLIAGLFDIIGVKLLSDLLGEGLFACGLLGFAFGAANGILRERDALVGTLQRLVMVVLSVLAPVLAFALVLFLSSLPITGLSGLWNGWVSAAALTLLAGAGAYLLLNAAIGLGDDDRQVNIILRWAALVLALVVLPLAALAAAALLLRVGQYGWTPERIWGVIVAIMAMAYGAAGWWAVFRGRLEFAPHIRTLQTRLALAVCALALILALPIIDFGAISARDQLARLQSGAVTADKFDWTAMAFDFGPAGRAALTAIARSGPITQRASARTVLAAKNRYDMPADVGQVADARPLEQRMKVQPAPQAVPPQLTAFIADAGMCRLGSCVVQWLGPDHVAVLGKRSRAGFEDVVQVEFLQRGSGGEWTYGSPETALAGGTAGSSSADLSTALVEVRTVPRRQIYIDGQPQGIVFE